MFLNKNPLIRATVASLALVASTEKLAAEPLFTPDVAEKTCRATLANVQIDHTEADVRTCVIGLIGEEPLFVPQRVEAPREDPSVEVFEPNELANPEVAKPEEILNNVPEATVESEAVEVLDPPQEIQLPVVDTNTSPIPEAVTNSPVETSEVITEQGVDIPAAEESFLPGQNPARVMEQQPEEQVLIDTETGPLADELIRPPLKPDITPEQLALLNRAQIRRRIDFSFGGLLQNEDVQNNAIRIRNLRLDQILQPNDWVGENQVGETIFINQATVSWDETVQRWMLDLDPSRRGAIYTGDVLQIEAPGPFNLNSVSLEDYENSDKEVFLHTRYRQTFINQGARPSYLLRELEAGRHEDLTELPTALMAAYQQIKPGVRVCLSQMIDGLPAQESSLGLVTTGGGAGAITAWQWLPSTLEAMNGQLNLGLSEQELVTKIGDGRNVFSVALFAAFLGTLGEEIEQTSTQFFNTLNITAEARDCLQAQTIVNAYNAGGPIMNDMLAGLDQIIAADEGLKTRLENLINEDPWLGYAALAQLAYQGQLASSYGPQASQYTPKIAWLNQAMNERYPLEDYEDLSGFSATDLLSGITEARVPRDQWLMAFNLVAQSETGREALRALVLDESGKVRAEIGNLAVFQIQHLYNGEPATLYVQKGRRITQAVWSEEEQTYVGTDGKRIKLFTGNGVTIQLPEGLEVSDPMLFAQELLTDRENYTIGVPGMEFAQLVSLGDIPGVEEVIGFPVRNGLRRSETTLVHALAAENLLALATAYADEFGEPLRFNEIHRSIPYQISLSRSSSVAVALAASSLHNVGLAIDINGLARSPEQQQWFRDNAGLYGFEQEAGEAWHFEYKGVNDEVETILGSSSYLRSNRAARNVLVERRMALARIIEQVVAPQNYLSVDQINLNTTALMSGNVMAGSYSNGRLVSASQKITEVFYVFDTTAETPIFMGVIKAEDVTDSPTRTVFDISDYQDRLTELNWGQNLEPEPVSRVFERTETSEFMELSYNSQSVKLFWPTSNESVLYYEIEGERYSVEFSDEDSLQQSVLPPILNNVFTTQRPRLGASLFTNSFLEKFSSFE